MDDLKPEVEAEEKGFSPLTGNPRGRPPDLNALFVMADMRFQSPDGESSRPAVTDLKFTDGVTMTFQSPDGESSRPAHEGCGGVGRDRPEVSVP